jgi:two-component system nitrate/nitrite response regulator NarL
MPGRVRIAIVDDHQLLADSVATALAYRGHTGVAVVDVDGSVVERVVALAPELVLLDLALGDGGDGRVLIRPLVSAGIKVAIVTPLPTAEDRRLALHAGAVAVLDKVWPFRRLLDEVEGIIGRPVEAAGVADLGQLTAREAQILGDLLDGHVAADIAEARHVALTTVRTHIRAVLTKLGVQNQLAAVAVAQRAGWRPPED